MNATGTYLAEQDSQTAARQGQPQEPSVPEAKADLTSQDRAKAPTPSSTRRIKCLSNVLKSLYPLGKQLRGRSRYIRGSTRVLYDNNIETATTTYAE